MQLVALAPLTLVAVALGLAATDEEHACVRLNRNAASRRTARLGRRRRLLTKTLVLRLRFP